MKNYKLFAPIILVVLFIASVYMTYDANGKTEARYEECLQEARSLAAQGIVVDALVCYTEALKLKPSLPLHMEIAQIYIETQDTRSAMNWGEVIKSTYPEQVEGYEYMMSFHHGHENYIACFQLADEMENRRLPMETVLPILQDIEYTYVLKGSYHEVSVFAEARCAVLGDKSWGFLDETGAMAIPYGFTRAGSFRQGLAPVTDQDGDSYFIDTEGNRKKVILGVESFEQLGSIEDGFFTLFDGISWGLFEGDGVQIIGGFDEVSSFTNGVVAVANDGKWRLLDSSGNVRIDKEFDGFAQDGKGVVYRNDRLFARENGCFYIMDGKGDRISQIPFQDARLFCDTTYAAVKTDGKWGFIDGDGQMVIEPAFDDARSFSGGFAAVKTDEGWGFINEDREMVILAQFEDAGDFNAHGCVFVKTDGMWTLLKLNKYNH